MSQAKATCPSEDQEQEAIFQWAKLQENVYPELKSLYACPNGGYRHIQTAARMKRTGTKPGVPDICLPVARRGFHGMYIELKRIKGGTLSDYQKEWLLRLQENGYFAVCAHGAEEAIDFIKEYLKR